MLDNLTESLAEFIVRRPLDDLPEAAAERAVASIVDTVACMLAGAGSEVREPLEIFLKNSGRSGNAIVVGTALKAPAELAAMVNGSFGHSLDFDDVLSMMPAHPSAVILPALFACAPQATTGEKLFEAFVIGTEVGAKIGLGISNAHYRRGFHATGTLAIFSALAALCRLWGSTSSETRTAFGIAASMASGLRCNFGTMIKPLHSGWAAHNAIMAFNLARSGMTAHQSSLEHEAGFFAAYGTEQSDMTRTLVGLASPWVFDKPGLALKKYPCIYALHRPIDALLALREKMGLTADNVEGIECRVAPGVMRPLVKTLPVTGLQSKFSMEYVLAVAALDGRYDLAAFEDPAVARPELKDLYPKVRGLEDARCLGDEQDPKARSAGTLGFVEITVTTSDGRSETMQVLKPTGSPEKPLGWNDLSDKFIDCAHHAGVAVDDAKQMFSAWKNIRQAGDIAGPIGMLEVLE